MISIAENNVINSPSGVSGIKVGIIGGAGYTGGELIRILINHPNVTIVFVNSKSSAGKPLHTVHHDLLGETELMFSAELSNDIDVLFLCVGHGDARKFLENNEVADQVKIIDLSQDFRLKENATFGNRQFIYGLVEFNRKNITETKNIANPGCFATAIQLGLLPLTNFTGLYKNECFTTGITGSTGAGQSLTSTSHFSWRANNVQAYKVLGHQHIFEIHETLNSCSNWGNANIKFIPYRGDFTRGIYITTTIHNGGEFDNSIEEYKNYYKDCPFVIISDTPIDLKQVVNTNKCLIYIEFSENDLIIHSVIDNLLKGASGQAVQNMNLMFGLNETSGLKLKATGF